MQVAIQIALLEKQTLSQLQGMWQKYFNTPPISKNKEFYVSRLAYRISEPIRIGFVKPNSLILAIIWAICSSLCVRELRA